MLDLLAKSHNIWLNMVLSFGADYDTAQDIVQSMYIRIHNYVKDGERIMYNDEEVNRFFIYVTLKNMYRSYKTVQGRMELLELREEEASEQFEEEVMDYAMEKAFETLVHKINKEMETWHTYDKLLSEKYLKTDYSLRDIAKGTGISLTSIFNSMRNNKKILKKKFGEDWEDFKNGDYDRIK